MAVPGRKPKPYLAAVREGNPGRRPLEPGLVLTGQLSEPDWLELLPGKGEMQRARNIAREMWRRLAPVLARSAGLSGEQAETLTDYCITWARIDQGERALSRQGVIVAGMMGSSVKNPWTTVLHQYRAHFRSLVGELGLSPAAASRITAPGGDDDDDDPFA
jgi:P27 family predicted phage terminase small subunit